MALAFAYILCYNIRMKSKYRRTNTTVSMVNYHLIFCPRYRRKIFLIEGVEARFKELVSQICEQNGYEILAMECDKDHCHLFVNVLPTVSPHMVMKAVKGATSIKLRKEFSQLSKMPNLWTRSYFVSTAGDVSSETIRWYISTQKSR